jgi:phosphate transport system substrate-binding protein
VDAPGAEAYPISSFTWLLVYQEMDDADHVQKLKDFIRWALTVGEASVSALDYAPLPENMVELEMQQLETVRAVGSM